MPSFPRSTGSTPAHSVINEDVPHDPFQDHDPWRDAADNPIPKPREDREPQRNASSAFAVGTAIHEAPAQRIIHDIPPVWNGDNPAEQLEPYVKLMKMWLTTSRTLKAQQGMIILQHATGDLRVIINEIDIDTLTSASSGELVLKHIQLQYAEYLEKKLPSAIEQGLFGHDLVRKKGESMLQYCTRRNTLFKKLAKEGWDIPELPKGYMLLRDANLPDKARDLIEMWSAGQYHYTEMQTYLKKLERPITGSGGKRITGLTAFVDALDDEEDSHTLAVTTDDDIFIFMNQSLFLLPESFSDEDLEEMLPYIDDPEVVYVAGDIPEDVLI